MNARARPYLVAALPVLAALATLGLVAGAGFSQRSPLPAVVEGLFYGFFLDRYPLFAFALVYALAHILVRAAEPGPASLARRAIWGLLGAGLLLALSLYPTFGGLVLRAGFGTGSLAFLGGMPMAAAFSLGASVAAILFGGVMGLTIVLATGRLRPGAGWRLGLSERALALAARVLALWFAALLIGLARDEGIGPWPRRAFTGAEAARAALLIGIATLPHALVCAFRSRRRAA